MPALSRVTQKAAYEQTSTDHAMIACALERYRLANGHLPGTLEELTPAYLKAAPPGVVNGEPPHYRLNADGTFLLLFGGMGREGPRRRPDAEAIHQWGKPLVGYRERRLGVVGQTAVRKFPKGNSWKLQMFADRCRPRKYLLAGKEVFRYKHGGTSPRHPFH